MYNLPMAEGKYDHKEVEEKWQKRMGGGRIEQDGSGWGKTSVL